MLFPPTFMFTTPEVYWTQLTTLDAKQSLPQTSVQLTSAAVSFSINSRSSSEISAPFSTNLGRMIAKIDGTSVMADSQCVIISNANSIAISAENRRSDIHTHGITPPTSV